MTSYAAGFIGGVSSVRLTGQTGEMTHSDRRGALGAQAEKAKSIPGGAGDGPGDTREAGVKGASVLEPVGEEEDVA